MRIRIVTEGFDFGELFLALKILIEWLEGQAVVLPGENRGSITMGIWERQGSGLSAARGMMRLPRNGVGGIRVARVTGRKASVSEEWAAWLPEEKECLYAATVKELEVSYVILSVSLDDGFALCKQGKLMAAREQAVMFSALYGRLADRLHGALRSLREHGREFGTFSQVAPLHLEWFRSEPARSMVRHHRLVSRLVLRERAHFFQKIEILNETITRLQQETHRITAEIADGTTLRWRSRWAELEMLHDDLNTCLREITVVLKSFFCVLPLKEVAPFYQRFRSLSPAPIAGTSRRWDPFLPKMAPACR